MIAQGLQGQGGIQGPMPVPNTDPPGHLVAPGAAAAPAAANPAAPRHSLCPMAGCGHPVHAEVQDQHTLGVQHGRHQRQAHKGLGQVYRAGAEALSGRHRWVSQVKMCPYCNNLYASKSSGYLNQHMKKCKERQQRGANGHNRAVQQQLHQAPAVDSDAAVYEWGLDQGSAVRECLDEYGIQDLLTITMPVSKRLARQHAASFSRALTHTLDGLRRSTASGDTDLGDAWAKLLHLLPALLMAPDGRLARDRRFRLFETGHVAYLVQITLKFARDRMVRQDAQSAPDFDLQAAASQARKQGLSRVARQLMEDEVQFAPRDQSTLDKLSRKHPAGDDVEVLQQAQEAGFTAAQTAQTNPHHSDSVFTSDELRTAIMAADRGTAAGLSGLSYSQLQSCMRYAGRQHTTPLLNALVWLSRQLFHHPETMSPAFRAFHTAARLSGIGVKVRPIACGDTMRRLFAGMWCRHHKQRIAKMLAPLGQYGCCVTGGTDIVHATTQLLSDNGGIVLTVDGSNAFNSLSRTAILTEVAAKLPDLYQYVVMLYGADSVADLVFALTGSDQAALIRSRQGIQQGDPFGPLLWAITMLAVAVAFRERFPQLALPSYLDDTYICSTGTDTPESETQQVLQAFDWLGSEMKLRKVDINPDKSAVVLPQRGRAPAVQQALSVAAAQRGAGRTPAATTATLVVGTPMGEESEVSRLTSDMLLSPKILKLLDGIVGLHEVDTQVAFALLRMCVASRVTHLVRSVPPRQIRHTLRRLDALSMGALAAVMQEPSAVEGNDEISSDWERLSEYIKDNDWDQSSYVSLSSAAQQQVRLRSRDGGFGITSLAQHADAAFLGRTVQCLGQACRGLTPAVRAALGQADALTTSSLLQGDAGVCAGALGREGGHGACGRAADTAVLAGLLRRRCRSECPSVHAACRGW